jgi:beta-mannosidase
LPLHIFSLNDNIWLFSQVPRRPFTAPDVYDLPAVTEWLPATVPGNVRTDLLALGRIPDPFFGEQYQQSLWVEDVDWWYLRLIEPDQVLGATHFQSALHLKFARAFLVFEGIDYLSAIFVNGREMARHEGMFSPQIVEITEALRAGPTEIAVRLWGSSALPKPQLTWRQRAWQKIVTLFYHSWGGIYPDRSASLKCQMSFGWDFAPPIRTMGIWDEVYLVISGPVFIVEASAIGQPVDQLSASVGLRSLVSGHSPADLTIHLTLDADPPRPVEATILITPANFEGLAFGPFNFPLDLPAGRSTHSLPCHLPEAALWWPWDRGQPHLYHVKITLTEPEGEPLDEVVIRTGIRAVDLENWQFTVNGQREFVRGLNWVPADSFPGCLRPEHYARLLNMARDSGANLLRVWGGGLREKRAFYDLCDELGLLVWQEFPFACAFLGSYPTNPEYLALVEAECSAIVRQLRRHPSLIAWCGGNEFSYSRNHLLLNTLATIVQQHDGSRPFIPVSPSFDHGADAHNWAVWHGYQPIQTYQTETARFLSEFGLQALPHLDTLTAALPDPSEDWETHHADVRKLARYADLFENVLRAASCVGETEDAAKGTQAIRKPGLSQSEGTQYASPSLQSRITASQLAQTAALQTAIEHMRRRKGEAGGVCVWQFNEPWPAISWAIVDYFGRPKLAYQRLAHWYHPILVSLKFPVGRRWQVGQTFSAEIWAVNDSLHAYTGCELQVALDGRLVHAQSLDLPADSARPVGTLTHLLNVAPHQLILTLRHQTKILAGNSYDLDWWDELPGPLSLRLRRWLADWALR